MSKEENIIAILETHFTGFREDIINSAVQSIMRLEALPGRWEDGTCSVCGFDWHDIQYEKTKVNKSPYCPNCGSRMEV